MIFWINSVFNFICCDILKFMIFILLNMLFVYFFLILSENVLIIELLFVKFFELRMFYILK